MGIFRRVNDIISANLNDLVDKFEEPEKMLKQAIREMEQSIEEATAAAAKAIASERLLAKELAAHEERSAQWQGRAEQAVKSGDDGLARQSLRRKHEHDKLVRALRDQLLAAQQTGQTLRRQVEAMRAKYAEARRKLATLTARSRAAHARKRFQAVGDSSVFRPDAFARIAARFETLEDDLDVEAELTAIKQRLTS